jgi:hypothetical protein
LFVLLRSYNPLLLDHLNQFLFKYD